MQSMGYLRGGEAFRALVQVRPTLGGPPKTFPIPPVHCFLPLGSLQVFFHSHQVPQALGLIPIPLGHIPSSSLLKSSEAFQSARIDRFITRLHGTIPKQALFCPTHKMAAMWPGEKSVPFCCLNDLLNTAFCFTALKQNGLFYRQLHGTIPEAAAIQRYVMIQNHVACLPSPT